MARVVVEVEEGIEIAEVLGANNRVLDVETAYTPCSPILASPYYENSTTPQHSHLLTPLGNSARLGEMGSNKNVSNQLQDSWLPVTASRNGNAFYAAFHTINSGTGFQALMLPVAFTVLGWAWGIICLSLLFGWQFYTIWLLIQLHESLPAGTRYSRYLHLSKAAFGEKLGKMLALFPIMYLSGGACVMLIIISGETMKLFMNIVLVTTSKSEPLSNIECYLMFICVAILLSHVLPNLNSLAWISFVGAVAAVSYSTLLSVICIIKTTPTDTSYIPVMPKSDMATAFNVLNAIGIIALAFRGHNVIVEIQATMPSTEKHPSRVPMWRGVKSAYLLIALCLAALALAGYWADGNKIANHGGLLNALQTFYGQNTARHLVKLTFLLVVIHCLTTFQLYAILAFDNMEFAYTSRMKKPCTRWIRSGIRVFFGCVTFFIAVALPFIMGLAGLVGGIALPVTLAYPCFMWINIKKPQRFSAMWCINMILGSLGMMLSASVFAGGIWTLINPGIDVRFFKP